MELRNYWKILKRRWLLIVIPVVIVLSIGLLTYKPAPQAYNTGVRFIVSQAPSEGAAVRDEDRYYNWLTSEYIVNGLTDWVRGVEFAQAVSDHLATQGVDIPAGVIQGGLAPDNARSMLTISLTANDAAALEAMMSGVIAVLTEQNAGALPQLGGEAAVLTQLDQPIINPISAGIRSQLDLPIRILLALFVGLGLALLVEYLDPTIRDRETVQDLGLSILGEIPRK